MRRERRHSLGLAALALAAGLGLAGCMGETLQRGYVPSESALQQVQVGAPREQVMIALGTPSTTADFGGEVFYYISQKTNRPVAFMNSRVVDQTRPRHLFRREQPGLADRQLRPGGRPDRRPRVAHHPHRRKRLLVPLAALLGDRRGDAAGARAVADPLPRLQRRRRRSPARGTRAPVSISDSFAGSLRRGCCMSCWRRDLRLCAPAPRAAAAPRCW